MALLQNDPNDVACPDFASVDYTEARVALITDVVDDATAIMLLTQAWTASNKAEKAIWARQMGAEAKARADAERQAHELQALRDTAHDLEHQALRTEEQKKNRVKYLPIPIRPPPTTAPEIPSSYATSRLWKGQYVELWYFTNDGLDYACQHSTTLDENTMVQVQDKDGTAAWVPAVASREARTVADDRVISWENFCQAVPRILLAMEAAKWPPQCLTMLANLWGKLQVHEFRSSHDPLDQRALIVYQAEQRRAWHQAIDSPGGAWDIGTLCESTLSRVRDVVYREDRQRLDSQRDYHVCLLSLSGSTLSDSLHVSFPLLSLQPACVAHVSMGYATRTSLFFSYTSPCTATPMSPCGSQHEHLRSSHTRLHVLQCPCLHVVPVT